MDEKKNFRKINEKEKKIIFASLKYLSPNPSPILKKIEENLFIALRKITSKERVLKMFLIFDDLKKILTNVNSITNPCSAGIYFGFIKKGRFLISLEGAEYLYKHEKSIEFHQLKLNQAGEKSILYGNHISKNMILQIISQFNVNDLLLLFNSNKEFIAIAQARVDSESIQNLRPKEIIALNIIDKGYYLRKEQ